MVVNLAKLTASNGIEGTAQETENTTFGGLAHRHLDRCASVGGLHASPTAVGGRHCDATHNVITKVLSHLKDYVNPHALIHHLYGVEDRWQVARLEADIDHGAEDLGNGAGIAHD
jgi:hypothetical protein